MAYDCPYEDLDYDPRASFHVRKDCTETIERTIERHILSFYKSPRRETSDQYRSVLKKIANDLEKKGIPFIPE